MNGSFLDHDPLGIPVPTPNSSQSTPLPRSTKRNNKNIPTSPTTPTTTTANRNILNQGLSSPSPHFISSNSSSSIPSSPKSMEHHHHHGLSLNLQQTNKRPPFFSTQYDQQQYQHHPQQPQSFKESITSPTNSSTTTATTNSISSSSSSGGGGGGRTATTRVDVFKEPRIHQTFQFSGTAGGKLKPHRVGFAEYGAVETGHPAFVIGGHGCSRLVGVMFEELAQRHSIRMIWPERPGYGLSEECSAQEMSALDWAGN